MKPTCNNHHRYYPRRDYKDPISRAFRQLPCHIVRMKIEDHHLLHKTTKPPKKPPREYMLRVLLMHKEGHCPTCHH